MDTTALVCWCIFLANRTQRLRCFKHHVDQKGGVGSDHPQVDASSDAFGQQPSARRALYRVSLVVVVVVVGTPCHHALRKGVHKLHTAARIPTDSRLGEIKVVAGFEVPKSRVILQL